ncbi:MAG: dihydroorotase [Burkholderiales bacterium]|nr:dihydroorotase [Burkholderiales bacterium]
MVPKLLFTDARLVDPVAGTDTRGALALADGRIVATGAVPADFTPDRIVDAAGCVLAPGLIDLCARLPASRRGFETVLRAAVAGGVTRLVCPPDTRPALDEPDLVEQLAHRADSVALAHVDPVGALTRRLEGERLAELAALRAAGCVAFGQADRPLADHAVLLRALQYAATFDLPVWLRAEDAALARHGVAHDGAVASRLGLPPIPAVAETVAVATVLALAAEAGARVHLQRLSTAGAVELVRAAKRAGQRVTCDVAGPNVLLSEIDVGFFDTRARLVPPLRTLRDRDALAAGLADGTIDALCSDHTPVDDDGKLLPFAEATPGASAIELLLPLALRAAGRGAGLAQALRPVVAGPARVLGHAAPSLAPGAVADLVLFDPEDWWTVGPDTLADGSAHTPFAGIELAGRSRLTTIGGRVVFERPPPR